MAQLCLTPHLVCNIMVKLKVCLFIPCFYVSLNSKNPCRIWCTLFMYIYIYIFKIYKKKIQKKISRFPNLSQKREKFSKNKKKCLWTKGIEPLSHLKIKKKKFFKLGALDFLVTFQKRPIFFFSKISRFFKVFFSKWYMRIPWTKLFLNCGV